MTTPAVRNLIREQKTAQLRNVTATGQQDGMITLEASLSRLVATGEVSHADAVAHSVHPRELTPPG